MENHVCIKAQFVQAKYGSEFQDQVYYNGQADHYAHRDMEKECNVGRGAQLAIIGKLHFYFSWWHGSSQKITGEAVITARHRKNIIEI